MQIQPDRPTVKAPEERFTGDVWVDHIADPDAPDRRTSLARVRFAPGARTAWHSHARGQVLHVTEGTARMQARGGQIIEVVAGQTVYTPPGEEHWHGASPDHFMEHIALADVDEDGVGATWFGHVADGEYNH